jgi:hypothetical protein
MTLFDFITAVKTQEYVAAILFIALFILYWEILKNRPFRSLKTAVQEDLQYVRRTGYRQIARTMGMLVAAPFVGLAYVLLLPLSFLFALATAVGKLMGQVLEGLQFGWRPTEAYLAGRRARKVQKTEDSKDKEGSK